MKTKHTEEPWRVDGTELVSDIAESPLPHAVVRSDDERWTALVEITDEEGEANAARIVTCVNGCAGIENPERLGEALACLRQIAGMNGNISLAGLDGKCGPNDGAARGIKARACIELAQSALCALGLPVS
jgi:hypothetical protein